MALEKNQQRTSKREWGLLFTSLVLTLLLLMGTGEIFLRVRYGSKNLPKAIGGGLPPHLVRPDDRTGYNLTPGFIGRTIVPGHADVEDRVNSKGLRDYERDFPASARLIFTVGDSMTYGHGVPFEKMWPTLLENKIHEKNPGYYVVKAGVPGFSWRQYYLQYQRLVKDIPQHALVIVGFNVDAGDRIYQGFEAKGGVIVKRLYPNLAVLDGYVYEKQSHYEWINETDKFLRAHSYFFRWFNQKIFFIYHQMKHRFQKGKIRQDE